MFYLRYLCLFIIWEGHLILNEICVIDYINVREYRRGQSKMENPETLATYGTQDKEKQNKEHNTSSCL
jgi:hypothetical protein